jgi:malate dehydrogenase
MKISIIGAGNVGSTLALRLLESNLADVVLLDIVPGLAKGKAQDLYDSSAITSRSHQIIGTEDYTHIKNSDIVVITAGLARKPEMSRDDLLKKNKDIVESVTENIIKFSPKAIIIIITNPLDTMSYITYRKGNFDSKRVLGMGGILDSARFSGLVAQELNISPAEIKSLVIGAHNDTMLPLARFSTVKGKALSEILPQDKIKELIEKTRMAGAKIVELLGSGSAYYAPSAAAFSMIENIIKDKNELISASVYLNGQYGLRDIFIGVPVRLGKSGLKEIVELELTAEEKKSFLASAQATEKILIDFKLK